jgi:hypothetical protein
MEPRYAPEDPFEDEYNPHKPPRWAKPSTYLEALMLRSVGRQHYKSLAENRAVRRIVKETYDSEGKTIPDSLYPLEWVKNCCEVAIKMREGGKMIQLKGLLTLIGNHERKREFLDRKQEQKGYKPRFQEE